MSPPASVPDASARRRRAPPIPTSSAFVSANAGSGKTHVLVNRVIRLLLDGVPPENILCITFTKAAAANMAQRVFDSSAVGSRSTMQQLDAAIRTPGSRGLTPSADARARIVRPGTGDAGRPEGADHRRALHPAAAAVSVRGERAGALRRARRSRPGRHDGAGQSRGPARRLGEPESAAGRALATAMTIAAT